MDLKNWLRKQAAAMTFAFSNVEKGILGQDGKTLATDSTIHEKKVTQTNLLQALINGEVNQEVRRTCSIDDARSSELCKARAGALILPRVAFRLHLPGKCARL